MALGLYLYAHADDIEQSEALLESTNVEGLVEHAATGLPPTLHEVGALMGEAAHRRRGLAIDVTVD